MSNIELIDFYADWCGPCQQMNPIIDEIEKEVKDVKVTKIDVDQNSDIAGKYHVMSIPTYIIKKDGQVVDQLVGAQSKENLLSKLR